MEDRKTVKSITESREANNIREDLSSLKHNVANVAHDIKDNGKALARDGIEQIKSMSHNKFEKLESHVREKPGQSIALAFAAGLALSTLLGRR